MCGIVGFTGQKYISKKAGVIHKMVDSINHRGPDSNGWWENDKIVLGHTRLAIIDLSEDGHQPMIGGVNDNLTIVFNGEIYNFEEIKSNISDYRFKTKTDTEVILAAYEKWGTECVCKFNGMFSFAIWDNNKEELFIARDRLGIKPLYFSHNNEGLVFASEIRAILQTDFISKDIDLSNLREYLMYQTVYAPNTLIKDIKQLMPGQLAVYKSNNEFKCHTYWDISEVKKIDKSSTYNDVLKETKKYLSDAVERRMISDVPIGAFLSGGIDSSAIVALMAEKSNLPINTFSLSFEEKEFDESEYALKIAEKYKTNHKEVVLKSKDLLKYLPEALSAMDVPSCDGVNIYTVSKLTKKAGITVALSGLGGDEIFMGYPVHNLWIILNRFKFFWKMPYIMRLFLSKLLFIYRNNRKAEQLREIIILKDFNLNTVFPILRRVLSKKQAKKIIYFSDNVFEENNFLASKFEDLGSYKATNASIGDICTYTQNILLRDADQMSMASALEIRVPFFDYKLVEYVLSLPDAFKISNHPKKLLIDCLGDKIPNENIYRKKMGFNFPWDKWIRTELLDFCDSKLNDLQKQSFINEEEISKIWRDYLNAKDKNISWVNIWSLVTLSVWLRNNNIG